MIVEMTANILQLTPLSFEANFITRLNDIVILFALFQKIKLQLV